MCDENEGDYEHCQDCGDPICFDANKEDEWPRMAYITSAGDVFCYRHGIQYDEEEERQAEEDMDYFPSYDDYPESLDAGS